MTENTINDQNYGPAFPLAKTSSETIGRAAQDLDSVEPGINPAGETSPEVYSKYLRRNDENDDGDDDDDDDDDDQDDNDGDDDNGDDDDGDDDDDHGNDDDNVDGDDDDDNVVVDDDNDNGDDDDDDDDDDAKPPDETESTTLSNTALVSEIEDMGIESFNNTTTDTEETVEELEEELQKEEEEAEQEYAAEDAELEAEGYVDGTPPLGNDDAVPMEEMQVPHVEPVKGAKGDEDVDVDVNVNATENLDIDIEKDLEIWEDVEEWNEATEEHDKEWFEEYDRTHSINPGTSSPTGKSQTEQKPGTVNGQRPPDDTEAQGKGHVGKGKDKNVLSPPPVHSPVTPPPTTTNSRWNNPTSQPEQKPGTVNGHRPPDGTEAQGKVNVGKGKDKNVQSPPPVPSPVSPPPTSTGSRWNNPTLPPATIADTTLANQHSLGFYAVASLVPIILLFCLGRYICRPKRAGDTRGEYRAVAARYGDMGYDNTFSDAMSDDEDDDFMDGHGDIEDDSWGKAGKRTLELPKFKKERNGGLSLEEMNG